MNKYQGVIIEESLENALLINKLKVISARVSDDEDPNERWHLYKVEVGEPEIKKISDAIKTGWYAHFWRDEGKDMIVVFKEKIFKVNSQDKNTWKDAIDFGLSVGIIPEQLEFLPE